MCNLFQILTAHPYFLNFVSYRHVFYIFMYYYAYFCIEVYFGSSKCICPTVIYCLSRYPRNFSIIYLSNIGVYLNSGGEFRILFSSQFTWDLWLFHKCLILLSLPPVLWAVQSSCLNVRYENRPPASYISFSLLELLKFW